MKPESTKYLPVELPLLERASQRWQAACHELGVIIEAPFILRKGDTSLICLAFLPNFGGPNGMVVGAMDLPRVAPDDRLKRLAKDKGLYLSFVNASVFANREVDAKVFKEALQDWGYYGSLANRPSWFAGHDHSQNK